MIPIPNWLAVIIVIGGLISWLIRFPATWERKMESRAHREQFKKDRESGQATPDLPYGMTSRASHEEDRDNREPGRPD